MRVLVLGAGMVGSVVAADLAATPGMQVTVADMDSAALERAKRRSGGRAKALRADAGSRAAVRALAKRVKAQLVVGALPSRFGYGAMEGVIDAKLPYVDISFMPQDFLELDAAAKRAGVPVVADCGVAPGMSNMLAGCAARLLNPCESIEIFVGGLPKTRQWPWQYKAPFSHHDVIEEYVRPSRVVEQGRVVVREALTEPELIEFPVVGTLEAVVTDGLRSLAQTLQVPTMKEKTMRYPGHFELMRVLRHLGLFSHDPVKLQGGSVRPIDMVAKLLFPHWTYEEGEPDITVMLVRAEGMHEGRPTRLAWTLHDELDAATGFPSMSRTTGFPAAAVARLVADGTISAPGVHAPEMLAGMEGVMDRVLSDMRARGVRYECTMQTRVPERKENAKGGAKGGARASGKLPMKAASKRGKSSAGARAGARADTKARKR